MKWLLLIITPDTRATVLASLLSALAFALGLLEMLSRNFAAAALYLNLSVGIMAFLFVLKYLSTRATYQVAEETQQKLCQQMKQVKRAQAKGPSRTQAEAVEHVKEIVAMQNLAGELKQALDKISPDSPVRPKYEATLELMQRIIEKG